MLGVDFMAAWAAPAASRMADWVPVACAEASPGDFIPPVSPAVLTLPDYPAAFVLAASLGDLTCMLDFVGTDSVATDFAAIDSIIASMDSATIAGVGDAAGSAIPGGAGGITILGCGIGGTTIIPSIRTTTRI